MYLCELRFRAKQAHSTNKSLGNGMDHRLSASYTTFTEVFDTYEAGEADAIVTAVENTLYGSINEVYQRIEECSAPIIGEVKLSIDQMLIITWCGPQGYY